MDKKNCIICGAEITREPNINDFAWNARKYCDYDCMAVATAARRILKTLNKDEAILLIEKISNESSTQLH